MSENFEKASETALKLLKFRNTRRGLIDKLRRKGFEKEISEAVADKMEKLGYINDEDYANAYVSDCITLCRYGRRKIRLGLAQRGVDKAAAEKALKMTDEEQDLENLRYFLLKAFDDEECITAVDAEKFRKKMTNRGFLRGQIDTVLSEKTIIYSEDYNV
ncbi:MAG: RecX family transcriptional regulator [Bacillota bacterium]|nr:RecX family transcriptional regulator [Bacillota bacterium]